ncbi:MAG: UvrB/UvrC motif-containing protein [Clostridiaceae bacterium]
MLCERCKKYEATYHITKIVDSYKQDIHLCEKCAKEFGEISSPFSFQNIISDMMGYITQTSEIEKLYDPRCGNCGTYFSEFKKKGYLGCSECYRSFEEVIDPIIRKVQGNIKHSGKIPGEKIKIDTRNGELEKLQAMLQKAVEDEEYEKAAVIRDQIKGLQNCVAKGE